MITDHEILDLFLRSSEAYLIFFFENGSCSLNVFEQPDISFIDLKRYTCELICDF